MEVLLGGLASILYGVADFLGGEGSKRAPAASIVFWSGVISFPLLLILALVVGGEAIALDFLLGALAGAAGAIGLVSLFAGLSRGQTAAVAPVSAAVGALVPVFVAVLSGERPSQVAWLGVALGVPAILLCAWVSDLGQVRAAGILYGVAAGLGFGGFTVIIRGTTADSNLLPLIASRGATMVLVSAIALTGIWTVTGFARVPGRIVVANGIIDTSANVALLFALRAGSLALAAVAASFYPAVTVLLARVVNSERLMRRQVVGLALTVVAVALIATA